MPNEHCKCNLDDFNRKLLEEAGGNYDNRKSGKCVLCGIPITYDMFCKMDEISRKEFRITGFCQECQDRVFKENND